MYSQKTSCALITQRAPKEALQCLEREKYLLKTTMASEKSVLGVIRAARPTFRNRNDKIAFAIHSSFLASGYILTATGPQALSDNPFSDPSNGNNKEIQEIQVFSLNFLLLIFYVC